MVARVTADGAAVPGEAIAQARGYGRGAGGRTDSSRLVPDEVAFGSIDAGGVGITVAHQFDIALLGRPRVGSLESRFQAVARRVKPRRGDRCVLATSLAGSGPSPAGGLAQTQVRGV